MSTATLTRCAWCSDDPLYIAYHDDEWGVPVTDDRKLFEMLILEGAQAGLAWITILRKREGYRRAFADFDPAQIARFDESDVVRLMADEGIVRNRLKIDSAIRNARVFLKMQEEHGSFADWLWRQVDYTPQCNRLHRLADTPATSPLSDQISKSLKKAGMNFVGSTIIYAFLQATGVVNDHLTDCHRYTLCPPGRVSLPHV
ncbi:DNA-3-methyladenine glycosylase I [Crenobacter sp. SG2305]|uniref:DNA-3-methyladenine glycosylase I n=1 Tax=Crenobacter oryzisoli TaxID=3056844 RepID=UPI0025AA74F0|nr:DNA-3-methyladenine glycosylase I [Crenobacter sp. SG2305]MDN0082292.1 DNA-3-methyladenine glycosylase I [Crenobacter sp. SG2305]